MRTSVMEINVDNFFYNVENIKKTVKDGIELIPIIKANAYGTYLNTLSEVTNQFNIVGVALVDEGIALRKFGYKNEILIINPCCVDDIDDAIENDLTISVSNKEFAQELVKKNEKIKINFEIETGMSRTGIMLKDLKEVVRIIKNCNNITVDGVFTHMSCADEDKEFTEGQIKIFNEAVDIIKKDFTKLNHIHISASNGILNFSNAYFNAVRPGLILYGYEPFDGAGSKLNMKPVCKLKSKITFLKNVDIGTSVGYGRSFVTTKETKIATVPLGYADGLKRCLSNKGKVYIKGKKCSIIGKVCMDSFMVDVTEIADAQIGDEVWIWDNENITLDDIAKQCDTISYEILTSISARVPRVFVKEN